MSRILLVSLLICGLAWADGGAGLHWNAPAAWKAEGGSRPMRVATYQIPQAVGDSEPGECVAYYFGKGQGGSVDANIERWTKQFEGGKPEVRKKSIHGLPITTIDISGTYTGMGGPMVQAKTSKPGYRLLGAIVEGPEGAVFFKFTAPAKTVAANKRAFEQMIDSVK